MFLPQEIPLPQGVHACAAVTLVAAGILSRMRWHAPTEASFPATPMPTTNSSLLGAIGEAIASAVTAENAAQHIVARIVQLTSADAGFLLAPSPDGFSVLAITNLSTDALQSSPVWSDPNGEGPGLAELALRQDEIVSVPDLAADQRWRAGSHELTGLRSLTLVPIQVAGKAVGCIGLAAATPGHFGDSTLDALRRAVPFLASILVQKTTFSGTGCSASQIDQVDRQCLELIAAITHEFRSPLSSIKASAEILLEQLHPGRDDTANRLLRNIVRNVERLDSLGSDLLEVARVRSAAVHLQCELVDLRTLVSEAVAVVAPTVRLRQQTVVIHTDTKRLLARVDRRRFEQVLINLLTNASNFAGAGAEINVRAFRQQHGIVVEVEDNGPGIPEDEQAFIFEPFYRGKSASVREKPGSGLGLAIARSLTELHGGHLALRSAVGRGSTFIITLPAQTRNTTTVGNGLSRPAHSADRERTTWRTDSR